MKMSQRAPSDDLIEQEQRDNLRLIDFIADQIGLPHDDELSQDNFLAWFNRSATPSDGMREALERLIRTANLLQQNSEGCAVNHYILDFEQQGLPGWLRDTKSDIENAVAALASLPAQSGG